MRKKFSLNVLLGKLTREEMKCIRGGCSLPGFPEARCKIVCNNGSIIGTESCPKPSSWCGDSGISSCTC